MDVAEKFERRSSSHEKGRWKIGMRKTLLPENSSPTVIVLVSKRKRHTAPHGR
jgi:hypothetical protein